MSLLALALLVMVVLSVGYVTYGSFIARQHRLDPDAPTPAGRINDGVDFVPTRPFYLMGQHFSAIAAAGPIVGPIAACAAFGWLPCLLWILVGVIFIGAVHDFTALVASVRHGAHSIAEIARVHLGRRAWLALVTFIWLALVYVIVAFTDVTAGAFVGKAEEYELVSGSVTFNLGGAVAAASVMYLLVALAMGLCQRWLRPPMWLLTVVFVPAVLGVVWLGTRADDVLLLSRTNWYIAILLYCFVASLLPMWLLQQSRGFLGGFVLYLAIGVGVVGLVFGGFEVRQPAVRTIADYGAWMGGGEGAPALSALIFPFLFVTIACGACSGFHGLVCGGTTSRQIAKETHCTPIAFGAMLLEGFVAVIALATIMIVAPADAAGKAPGVIYGEGLARFLTVLLGPDAILFAKTFGTMAVATFIFDTLDVATRLGRYLLQELFRATSRLSGVLASALTAGVPLLVLMSAKPGSWQIFWTLFGTANQLLAALTLLGVSVWLRRSGRRSWYTLWPMAFVMTITLLALGLQIVDAGRALAQGGLRYDPRVLNGVFALAMLGLAGVFVREALRPVPSGSRPVLTGSPGNPQA